MKTLAIYAGLLVVAEAVTEALAIPKDLSLTNIASIGFAVWYGIYVTKWAIPRIIDKHDAQVQALVETHSKQLSETRDAFAAALAAQRQDCTQSAAQQRADFLETIRQLREKA